MSGENNPNFGKPKSEEAKKKIGDANRGERSYMWGKQHTEEHKNKMSEMLKGEKSVHFGKKHSEERRMKSSESHQIYCYHQYTKEGEFIRSWLYSELKQHFRSPGNILDVCCSKPRAKTAYGYVWRKVNLKSEEPVLH